jgi:hypothetical protein
MKSKLLQKISYGVNQALEVVDGQKENDSSRPTNGHGTLRNPVNPAAEARAGKDFPGYRSEITDLPGAKRPAANLADNPYRGQHVREPSRRIHHSFR